MWNLKLLAVTGTLIATSLAGTAWYAHSKGKQQGKEMVQAMWNAERLAVTAAQAEEAMKARQKEQALQTLLGPLIRAVQQVRLKQILPVLLIRPVRKEQVF